MIFGKNNITFLEIFAVFFLFFCSSNALFAQSYWMQRGGGTSNDEANSISIDAANNTYTTGYFTGSATFGFTNLTASGVSDVFVTKTNSLGVYQWAVKGGDGGSDRGLAIKTDANGNSYVTGYYYGTATFGPKVVTAVGLQDVFIVKYDKNGNVKWLVSGGGPQADIGNGITIDKSGNVIVTGEFAGTATFGSFNLTATGNNVNVFTAKLDSATGNFIWAKSGVGPHTDRGLGVACDASNNVYVTGQFSDTITFDNVHYSSMYNGIFLIKYSSAGTEQWFTSAGGGTSNIANAIAVDNGSNVYLTGDFTGTLTFFVSPVVTLSNTYPNRIFIAKYNSGGNLLWATADGSTNGLTSRSIDVDGSGNAYIIGNFECIMNSYADQYGQGTFNTVGFWDIFTSEYSSSGSWQWSRQIGGHNNNYGNGIAVSSSGSIYTAGSFDQDMIITTSPKFIGYNAVPDTGCNTKYCSDSHYGDFAYFNTAGGLDIFVAEPIDLSRQTYDYYVRKGNSCNRPRVSACINPNCADTVKFCGSGELDVNSNTCPVIGPNYTYQWSNNQNGTFISVNSAGTYTVTQTTADGCFSTTGSVYVDELPLPSPPNLSDNVPINTKAVNPVPIHICADSVMLTGGGFGANPYYWSGGSTATTVSIEAKKSGTYCFNVKDPRGCIASVCVQVTLDSAFKNIKPKLICLTCSHDTAFICKGHNFEMLAYDSISNPNAIPSDCIPPSIDVTNRWYVKPSANISFNNVTHCPNTNTFTPSDSGWFHITDTVWQENFCDTIKKAATDSVFVRLYPVPVIGPVFITAAKTLLCPPDSVWVVAHDTSKFSWSNGSTKDSLYVGPGSYSISTSITNKYGCNASATASITIAYRLPPVITAGPATGVICPNDSIQLTTTGVGSFQWYGPSGPIGNNSPTVWVKVAGSYYCVVTDTAYCNPALSNTVILTAYATPFLAIPKGGDVICPGDTAKISVVASAGCTIQWEAPLSGSDTVQYLTKAGTYTCKITSCGITTTAHVTIIVSNPVAKITPSGPENVCVGDTVTLTANNGMAKYLWTPGNSTATSIIVTKSGVYTLTTTDTNGCHAKAVNGVTVNVNNLPLPLSPDTSVCPDNSITLYAVGWSDLYWYSDSLNVNPIGAGPSYITPNLSSDIKYYVQTLASDGCKTPRIPVNVKIADCSGIYIPNIFTPNGDGKNDIWYVTIRGTKCFSCQIYNRWGVMVYTSDNIDEGWNGLIRQTNEKASDGVYYYIINFCNYDDKTYKRDGFIQLIRN